MDIINTLQTGSGFWNPIIWISALIIAMLIAYIIRGFGEHAYKKGTEQDKPFISGNPEPAKAEVHVRAGNIYWGFLDALKGYYDSIVPLHTGIINDYVGWFIGIMAIILIVVGLIK
jgi:hypothetical protein